MTVPEQISDVGAQGFQIFYNKSSQPCNYNDTDWHAWLMTKSSRRVTAVILGPVRYQANRRATHGSKLAWICGQTRVSLVNRCRR